jgi:hypothetical protein
MRRRRETMQTLRTLAQIIAEHLSRYPAAPTAPSSDAPWWARERHAERQRVARSAAYRALSDDAHNAQANAHAEPPRSWMTDCYCTTWTRTEIRRDAADVIVGVTHCGGDLVCDRCQNVGRVLYTEGVFEKNGREWAEYSLASEPGYSLARSVEDAAAEAVPFHYEETPAAGVGAQMYLGKGTGHVSVPPNAVARRGGGECSYVIFYDRNGMPVAAYATRSRGPETWVESVPSPIAEAHFARYHYPIERLIRTPSEDTRATLFGVAS